MLNIKTLSFAQWCQVQSFKNTWCVMNETTFLRYSYYIYNIHITVSLYITPPFHSIFFIYKTPFCTLDLPRIKWSSMLIYIYCHNQSLGREKIVFICSYYIIYIYYCVYLKVLKQAKVRDEMIIIKSYIWKLSTDWLTRFLF